MVSENGGKDLLAVMDADARGVALWADNCPERVKAMWAEQLRDHDKAREVVAKMIALLTDIRGCGEWYRSALEIDTYAGHGHDGENLKARLDELLGPDPSDEA